MLSVIYITFIVTGKTIGTQYISLFTMSKSLCKYPFEEIVKNFMIFECREAVSCKPVISKVSCKTNIKPMVGQALDAAGGHSDHFTSD